MPKMKTHCHWLIAKNAREFAAAFYEQNAIDNAFYKAHPEQKEFVSMHWGKFVESARTILAKMLAGNYPESMKEQIFEALELDAPLAEGRRRNMLSVRSGNPIHGSMH